MPIKLLTWPSIPSTFTPGSLAPGFPASALPRRRLVVVLPILDFRRVFCVFAQDGSMTVNQAMMRVRMKEQRAAELRLQLPLLATGPEDPTEADGSADGGGTSTSTSF